MRKDKDVAKAGSSKRSPAVAAKASAAATAKQSKRSTVKVVEVELSSQAATGQTVAKSMGGAKPATVMAPVSKAADPKVKVARPKARIVAKAKRPVEVATDTASETIPPEILLAPTPEILKPFRLAAEENRRRIRAGRTTAAGFLAKPLKNGKKYSIDLRLHSPGSQGFFSIGGFDPGPALVRLAKVKGLDMIALTDFFNASYIDLVRETAVKSKLTVLPGIDLRCRIGSCDEVFMAAMFPESRTGADLFRVLDKLGVPESARGRRDYCLRQPFSEVLALIEAEGGLMIPSRLDKTPYRQLAITALVEEFGFHAFDLVYPESIEYFKKRWASGGFTFFTFSNATALGQIGSRIAELKLSAPTFGGLKEIVSRRPFA